MYPFIANTDGRIDEANFWSPKSTRSIKQMEPGTPFFLRLKHPRSCIAGYGFFAHFDALELDLAWDLFGWRNGAPDKIHFLERIGAYRGVNLLNPRSPGSRLGSTILRAVYL